MEDFEKLGLFYLGKSYDLQKRQLKDDLLLYDSKDLTTHAVCVGMTGSGKTGLCISLIEEAAIDGIPAILIDPKGDLANLALTFPNFEPADFRPWINQDIARQKGLTPDEFAAKQASLWKNGLIEWGQGSERLKKFQDAVEVRIYTPGSNAGLPVSILSSFAAPSQELINDSDILRDRINSTVSSLLGLIGIKANPVQSREHILLSTIFDHYWKKNQSLDLAGIIQSVQDPPLSKIGILDLESFYPSKDRFSLVMALNNLLASPGFSNWLEGTPLQIDKILYSPQGKPRLAIFSIAHLSDPERMFFVSLLMNQILGWMRGLPGTTSLRALVYMDEIFGYLPPVENPPSKLPMLTLLKQARAFGIGMVFATQNPVDLDYKALSNAGTWFIGRLQTEQDKNRLIDGLESASNSVSPQFNRKSIEKIISSLENRVFLMNNTHEDTPEVFQTRWALSYLRGPLTRDDIKVLMDPVKSVSSEKTDSSSSSSKPIPSHLSSISSRPTLKPSIQEYFLPARGKISAEKGVQYLPKLLGVAKINLFDPKAKTNLSQATTYITDITDDPIAIDWDRAEPAEVPPSDLEKDPLEGATFSELPPVANQDSSYTTWTREFSNWLYGSQKLELLSSKNLKTTSNPGESEKDFRLRLQQLAREHRDENLDMLRKKYSLRDATLKERLRKAEERVEKQADQAKRAKFDTAISIGSTLFGAFTGRKLNRTTINRASSSIYRASRSKEESNDVDRAEESVDSIKTQITDLQAEFTAEVEEISQKFDPMNEELETTIIKPRKTDILVQLVCLVWAPYWREDQGEISTAW